MTDTRIYLDYNATAPLLSAARQAMLSALDSANPSSVHAEGRAARQVVETARRQVAALVNGSAEHVVFTSGATEAANMLLSPDWTLGRAPLRMGRLYVCTADHPCLLAGGRFSPGAVERIGVDANGILDLGALEHALARHDKTDGLPLVAVHAANNETGVLQPIAEIGRLTKAAGGVLVLDAVQAAGRVALDVSVGDFLIVSSHKIGGPKGVGAVIGAGGLMMPGALVTGGGQERGQRAGTENVAAIAGFGAAAEEALAGLSQMERVAALRERLEASIRALVPDAVIHGKDAPRLPNTVFFSIPGMKAETVQIAFDLAGVAVSAGSACSSGKVGPSHVLAAMGFREEWGAVRVSLGVQTENEIARFAAVLQQVVRRKATKAA